MKTPIAFIIGLFLLTFSLFSAEIMVAWDNPTNSVPVSLTNIVYVSTNSFPDTNALQVRVQGNESNAIIPVVTGPNYKLYVEAWNILPSEPSNQIRYQRIEVDIRKSTSITIDGATNWAGAILTKPPTNGILIGSPPFFMYTPTNTVAAVKDRFTYQISETWMGEPITNYYSIHFQYPNQSPKMIDQVEVIVP